MATSIIKSTIEHTRHALLAWGDYDGDTTFTTQLTESIKPGCLAIASFGTNGRYQVMFRIPAYFGNAEVLTFPYPDGDGHFQFTFKGASELYLGTLPSGIKLKTIEQFPDIYLI